MTTSHLTPELLTDYIRGELLPADDARAHAHLSLCRECRLALEAETSFSDELRRVAATETFDLPPDLKETIRQKARGVRAQPLTHTLAALRPVLALPIAAAILVGTLAFPSLMRMFEPERPTIDASFYLDAHAAQHAAEPFSEHNPIPTSIQTAYAERTDTNDVLR